MRIEIIESDNRYNSEHIVTAILEEWLQGRGKDTTWQVLIDTLKRCELTVLAENIGMYIGDMIKGLK